MYSLYCELMNVLSSYKSKVLSWNYQLPKNPQKIKSQFKTKYMIEKATKGFKENNTIS